jgi:hypothetical protein
LAVYCLQGIDALIGSEEDFSGCDARICRLFFPKAKSARNCKKVARQQKKVIRVDSSVAARPA